MADKINPEHPAYPWGEDYPGIDIRTHLAAIALQGLLANGGSTSDDWVQELVIKNAVSLTDKLITELNK